MLSTSNETVVANKSVVEMEFSTKHTRKRYCKIDKLNFRRHRIRINVTFVDIFYFYFGNTKSRFYPTRMVKRARHPFGSNGGKNLVCVYNFTLNFFPPRTTMN